MNMNFENAFTFIKQDENWKKKLAIGGVLSLAAVVILFIPLLATLFGCKNLGLFLLLCLGCFVLDFLIYISIMGYTYIVVHNRINDKEEILPDWCNFGRNFFVGIKSLIGNGLFLLPIFIAGAMLLLSLMILSLLPPSGWSLLMACIFVMTIFILSLLGSFYMLASYLMMTQFSTDLRIVSFIDFKNAYSLLKGNWVNYLILLLLLMTVSIIMQIAGMVLICTIVGILLIPALCFYLSIVCADLLAQFAKLSKK